MNDEEIQQMLMDHEHRPTGCDVCKVLDALQISQDAVRRTRMEPSLARVALREAQKVKQ